MNFPEDFAESERGNTWLLGDNDNHYILIGLNVCNNDIEASHYLEISMVPDNYPGFTIETISIYNEELKKFIQDRYAGWAVRKWNLPFDAPVDEVGEIKEEDE